MTVLKWQNPATGEQIALSDRRTLGVPARPERQRDVAERTLIASHESRHAAAAMILGFPVSKAAIGSHPESPRAAGYVEVKWTDEFTSQDRVRDAMVGMLVGPEKPPTWPLRRNPLHDDEHQLAVLAEFLRFDESDYAGVCADARALVESPYFKTLASSIQTLLEHIGTLTGRQLQDVYRQHEQRAATKSAMVATKSNFGITESATALDNSGVFEATVAVFGNVDYHGDRILPGAFDKTLSKWRDSGDPIPVIWSHQSSDPNAHIGVADPWDVKTTKRGLRVKGTLDVEDNPLAARVYKLLKRRSLKEFSFGYIVPRGGSRVARDGVNDISEIDLHEIGPTLTGANPRTELHGVKGLDLLDDGATSRALRRKCDEIALQLAVGDFVPDPTVQRGTGQLADIDAMARRLGVPGVPKTLLERERNGGRVPKSEAQAALMSFLDARSMDECMRRLGMAA